VFFWVILASVAVALLRGGRLKALADLPFRHGWLVIAAFALRAGLGWAPAAGIALSDAVVWAVQAVSHLALLAAVVINRQVAGVPTLGLGILGNALAILSNGGRMPVSPEAVAAVSAEMGLEKLFEGGSYLHQPMAEAARLSFLADILPSPAWLPGNHVYSIGDLLIMAGLFVMIQRLALRPPAARPAGTGTGVA